MNPLDIPIEGKLKLTTDASGAPIYTTTQRLDPDDKPYVLELCGDEAQSRQLDILFRADVRAGDRIADVLAKHATRRAGFSKPRTEASIDEVLGYQEECWTSTLDGWQRLAVIRIAETALRGIEPRSYRSGPKPRNVKEFSAVKGVPISFLNQAIPRFEAAGLKGVPEAQHEAKRINLARVVRAARTALPEEFLEQCRTVRGYHIPSLTPFFKAPIAKIPGTALLCPTQQELAYTHDSLREMQAKGPEVFGAAGLIFGCGFRPEEYIEPPRHVLGTFGGLDVLVLDSEFDRIIPLDTWIGRSLLQIGFNSILGGTILERQMNAKRTMRAFNRLWGLAGNSALSRLRKYGALYFITRYSASHTATLLNYSPISILQMTPAGLLLPEAMALWN